MELTTFLDKKKNGSTKFCIDYRNLNDVISKDSYLLPRIDDTFDTLAGTKWFPTLNLQSEYWMVETAYKNKERTAVIPFGLHKAPATFERLMEHILKGPHWKTCLDEIIVLGRTFDEHFKNLAEILQRITMAGMKLSVKKCDSFQKQKNELLSFLRIRTYY